MGDAFMTERLTSAGADWKIKNAVHQDVYSISLAAGNLSLIEYLESRYQDEMIRSEMGSGGHATMPRSDTHGANTNPLVVLS